MNIIEFIFALIRACVPISDTRVSQLESSGKEWFSELEKKEVSNPQLALVKEHANAWYTQTFLAIFYIFALRWTLDFINPKDSDGDDD